MFSFNHAILTREDARLRQMVTIREGYQIDVNMLLPNEVEWALARLFDVEIKIGNAIKEARLQLANLLD